MSHPHPLTWLYRKLGARYPSVFITVELQSAFLVATGAVALFSFYYSVSSHDFLKILAVTLGLTAVGVGFVLGQGAEAAPPTDRLDRRRPHLRGHGGAWHLAVNLPVLLVRRDFYVPLWSRVITVDRVRLDPRAELALLLPDPVGGSAHRRLCGDAPLPRARAGHAADPLRHQLRARSRRCGSTGRRCRCGSSCWAPCR